MNRMFIGSAVLLALVMFMYFSGSMDEGLDNESNVSKQTNDDSSQSSEQVAHEPLQVQVRQIENDQITLLATSSVDAKAVVRIANGASRVISVGDQVGEPALLVNAISKDKIVLKNTSSNEVYYVFLVGDDGKSKKQTLFSSIGAQSPSPVVPIIDSDEQSN